MFKKFIHVQTVEAFVAELQYAHNAGLVPPVIKYTGTVKLHGTNAGIVVNHDGSLTAQSRNRSLTPENDSARFAKFLEGYTVDDLFVDGTDLSSIIGKEEEEKFVVFGEWVGKGIQKGTACSLFEERRFVAFALATENGPLLPAPKMKAPFDNVATVELTLNIKSDGSNYLTEVAKAMELTDQIDAECPWAKSRGVVGHGEGVVWMPEGDYPRLWLKTKGLAHKKSTKIPKNPEDVTKEREAISSLYAATDGPTRVSQGIDYLTEMGKEPSMKTIPDFIKWFNIDFARECAATLALASQNTGFDQKFLRKGISSLAVQEFRACLLNPKKDR